MNLSVVQSNVKGDISFPICQLTQLLSVNFYVHLEAALIREPLPTLTALKWLVLSVHCKVLYVVALLYEGLTTNTACI
jgi:hypothetical protein